MNPSEAQEQDMESKYFISSIDICRTPIYPTTEPRISQHRISRKRPSVQILPSEEVSKLETQGHLIDATDLRISYGDFTTIDWMRDLARDHRRKFRFAQTKHTIWEKIVDNSQSWILISIIGLSIGLVAGCIDVTAAWLTDLRIGYCHNEWYASKAICCKNIGDINGNCSDWIDWSYAFLGFRDLLIINWIFYMAFSILFAFICVVLVVHMSKYAAGSGTAEIKTILGGFVIKGFLGSKTLLIKTIGLPLMVASGLAIGKEGPMIHVASCIGNIFPRFFSKYKDNEGRKREILSASVAAGIAVAFGAPMGGVLFSLEELSSFFPGKTMIRSFFCALVSTVTLQLIDPYRGKRVLYQVTTSNNWNLFEILFFITLGIFGGLSGALFIKMNTIFQRIRNSKEIYNISPIKEAVILACITSAIGFWNTYTWLDSSVLLEMLFQDCNDSSATPLCSNQITLTLLGLLFAMFFRIILSIITFGIQMPAGVFIPSMVWGALFGRFLGITVQQWQRMQPWLSIFYECHPDAECISPGMYSLLGALSALGGVTRLTLCLTVIMFELTGTLNYIIPCMICLTVSKLVADIFGKKGIVEIQIQEKGLPFLDPREEHLLGVRADEVMTLFSNLTCFTGSGMRVKDIEEILQNCEFQGFPVIQSSSDNGINGFITRGDLEYALKKIRKTQGIDPLAFVFFNENATEEPKNPDDSLVKTISTPMLTSLHELANDSYSVPLKCLDLSQFMDKTPLSVPQKLPIEVVIDFFTKLGPRYIIVKEDGRLMGLITKKDVLKFVNR